MTNLAEYKIELQERGYCLTTPLYSPEECHTLIRTIEAAIPASENFRRGNALFAIRNFMQEVPQAAPLLWTPTMNSFIDNLLGSNYQNIKAIYFDKPPQSNWLVNWHQDTTISVDREATIEGFGPWTRKHTLPAVQPTREILENIYTLRLHLDECTPEKGALSVLPGSHSQGILSAEQIHQSDMSLALSCPVAQGAIMVMRPLLLHASAKNTGSQHRRVLHLEFASCALPGGLQWREFSPRQ